MYTELDGKEFFNLLLMMKGGLLKLNYCWMGKESWHAIKKLQPTIPDSQVQVSSNKLSNWNLFPGVVRIMNSNDCMYLVYLF